MALTIISQRLAITGKNLKGTSTLPVFSGGALSTDHAKSLKGKAIYVLAQTKSSEEN